MPTINDIRAQGTDVFVNQVEMPEPLLAPESLKQKLSRFDSPAYNISQDSHLFKLLVALCGDAGAGSLKRELLYPRLQNALSSTYFHDLDRLYGNPLALPRLSQEIYLVDPRNEALTQAQWRDVKIKDALYRSRCLTWMRAILAGPTPEGLRLAAEAALGYEADIFEQYFYQEYNLFLGSPVVPSQTTSINEFTIIPRAPSVTEQEKRTVINLVDKLRPINSIPTIVAGDAVRTIRPIANVVSTSDNFTVLRTVTGQSDVDWPAVDSKEGFWIEPGIANEAPTFAWIDRSESVTYLTIDTAAATSTHIGDFSKTQKQIFVHLATTPDPFFEYSADKSTAKFLAPFSIVGRWA